VGSLIDIDQPLVLITEDGKEYESILRLARVGYENVLGYLKGGIQTWANSGKAVQTVQSIRPESIMEYVDGGYTILDVRRTSETETEHLEGAKNLPLVDLEEKAGQLDPQQKYVIHCAGGYRSMIAASLLKSKGFNNIVNVYEGFDAIKMIEGMPLISGKCPTQVRNEKLETLNSQ
jgi:rhodanese-related sulfurtransferase